MLRAWNFNNFFRHFGMLSQYYWHHEIWHFYLFSYIFWTPVNYMYLTFFSWKKSRRLEKNLTFLPVTPFPISNIIKQLLVRSCWWLSVSVCNWNFKHFNPMNSLLIESKWNPGFQSDSVFASIPLKPNVDMNRFNARGSRFDFSILTKEVHLAAKRNILASTIFPHLSRF